jgi:peroxiredoxin
MTLQVGDAAPEFTVRDQTGRGQVSLSDFAGKPVVLAFYVLAFTGG